jgi:hypothetical protein
MGRICQLILDIYLYGIYYTYYIVIYTCTTSCECINLITSFDDAGELRGLDAQAGILIPHLHHPSILCSGSLTW